MELEKLEYKLLNAPTDEIRELLSRTVYGTVGGLQLRHRDTSWKLDELISPDYHVLYDTGKLVGVVVYSNRRAKFGGIEFKTLYIRYFSISPEYQNKGVAKYLTEIAVKNYRETLKEPTVVYAFIEAKNTRSVAVGDFFEPLSLGYFSPIYFSRFSPKKKLGVNTERDLFDKYYPTKEQVNFEYQGRSDRHAGYFTLERNDRYATLKCYPVSWEIMHYPNNNWLMMNLLPRIPFINKLVEGSELNFVAVDALAWNDNDLLIELFEHVLAQYQLSKLMVYADTKDSRFDQLRSDDKLGMMGKLQKPPKVGIQLFFHDCDDTFKKRIQDYPVEVRGFDVT
ncbi:MAG: GNAT family N-acetyltransferase [Flavobacteriales bacterium]|nr:GNAT family N-acetyltransferase [Flavobacteriales bacterium]